MEPPSVTPPEPTRTARAAGAERLPFAAYAFVVLALVALALGPTLLLERVSAAARELTTTLLPVHDRLRQLALSMERQSAAVRGFLISGEARYRNELEAAIAAETAALRELDPLLEQVGPGLRSDFDALRRLSVQRYARTAELMAPEAEGTAETWAELEVLRDSVLVYLAGVEREVLLVTSARASEEARWAERQRWISLLLGALAVVAVLLVGWFARRQQRLMTEVERALATAEHGRAQLEKVTESRARLMRGFGHDVKNPLGAAGGYLSLLAEGVMGPLTPTQRLGVDRAGRSIDAGLNLVDDLLELARAETGGLELAPAVTDIREVVLDAAEEYRAQAEAKGLTLVLDVPPAVSPVTTDGRRVRQVLGNLISNAVKYTVSGRVTVRLEARGPGGGVAIRVTDTGPGIPAEARERLFEEWVRLDPSAAPGAGVGLMISRRIAEALGGEITVESERGAGSTFTLRVPAAGPPASAHAAPPRPAV